MFRIRSRSRILSHRQRRASVMVETSLCLAFVLLPMTAGVVQYGVLLSTMHALDQLVREGGRYASVHAGEANFDSSETTTGSLRYYLKSICDGKTTVLWSDISPAGNITCSPALASRSSGQPLTVTISYNLKKKFFLMSFPGMNSFNSTYTSKATFVME